MRVKKNLLGIPKVRYEIKKKIKTIKSKFAGPHLKETVIGGDCAARSTDGSKIFSIKFSIQILKKNIEINQQTGIVLASNPSTATKSRSSIASTAIQKCFISRSFEN